MRAILIDPEEMTIGVIDHPGTADALQDTIGCRIVEAVQLSRNEDIWLNEEGLLLEPHKPLFRIGPHMIAGRAVVLGLNASRDTCATRLPLFAVIAAVEFLPDLELKGWRHVEGVGETPFGPMPVFGSEPIFGPKEKPEGAAA